jgi:phage tail P2-like protein
MSGLLEAFDIDKQRLQRVADFLILNDSVINNTELPVYYNNSSIIDQIANLYGYTTIPWDQYISQNGTNLLELLNFTLYLYKFGAISNFYEKHLLDFVPEYDREQIQASPKLKLSVESLGRKLDNIEDILSRFPNLYSIDNCPEELLDYLGQTLGYEREDFTLTNVSFRELLKNIIEIYKIKGTNYSFSFFFKFLGFNIDLTEFYFNKDVINPESFPGIDEDRVEFFLSHINPTEYHYYVTAQGNTTYIKPAVHLYATRNLNDWDQEIAVLKAADCSNASKYMRGVETKNNDGVTWHPNPWNYFKTNLIEYNLNPFITKLNLTATDNETIKKYVKFLSPTYLFTWININVQPWIEDYSIAISNIDLGVTDPDNIDTPSTFNRSITVTLGDSRPTPDPWPQFQPGQMGVPDHAVGVPFVKKTALDPGFSPPYSDHEQLGSYYDSTGTLITPGQISVFNKGSDLFTVYQTNWMNLNSDGKTTQDDQIGTPLRRDGTQIRKPGHPKYIASITHKAVKHLTFDSLGSFVKNSNLPDSALYWQDYSYRSYPASPITPQPFDNQIVSSSNIVTFDWDDIVGASSYTNTSNVHYGKYHFQLSKDPTFSSVLAETDQLDSNVITTSSPLLNLLETKLHNGVYHWRVRVDNGGLIPFSWTAWSSVWNFILKVFPYPYDGENLSEASLFVIPTYDIHNVLLNVGLDLMWESVPNSESYQVQVSNNNFQTTLRDEIITTNAYQIDIKNGIYQWRHRPKDRDSGYPDWSTITPLTFTIDF